MAWDRRAALGLALVAGACGGGGAGGPTPAPLVPVVSSVAGFVYYDEDGGGAADPRERVRLPGVTVEVGGRRGMTDAHGNFAVTNVPEGSAAASLLAAFLPPYFVAGEPANIGVPYTGGPLSLGATLPIGGNRPNVYLAFGDSITAGDGSGDGNGYLLRLERDLAGVLGDARVLGDGQSGTRTNQGLTRLPGSLAQHRPAYALILYGTNDWNRLECKDERFPCFTIDSLRAMLAACRSRQTLPVLSTIIPANPAFADRDAAARNDWVVRMNAEISRLAEAERVPLADPHGLFLAQSRLEPLFVDHVHPSDAGHDLIATAFLQAVTSPR